MILQLLISLTFAKPFFPISEVLVNDQVRIEIPNGQNLHPDSSFKLQTPNGDCFLSTVETFAFDILADSSFCDKSQLVEGRSVELVDASPASQFHSTQNDSERSPQMSLKESLEPIGPTYSNLYATEEPSKYNQEPTYETSKKRSLLSSTRWDPKKIKQNPTYLNYIKDKMSLGLSYHVGQLSGAVDLSPGSRLDALEGGHTLGFFLEYLAVQVAPQIDLTMGFSFLLPRSFGNQSFSGRPTALAKNPTLYNMNFRGNLAYKFRPNWQAYVGLSHILAELKHLPAETSGDLGFQLGARYEINKSYYAETAFNFQQLDIITSQGRYDMSLNEFALRFGLKL